MADLLTRAAGVDDYTWFWWKLRPHPKLGTVEIRTLDAQSSLRDTEALVALTHCLARAAAEQDTPDELPTELLEEGMFRATRFGVHARLPDARGGLHEFQEVLDAALELATPHAAELGCAQGLARIPALVAGGGGAGHQRAVHELSGIDSVLRDLIATTAETSRITQH
jgi:carboxylate-amine ligase